MRYVSDRGSVEDLRAAEIELGVTFPNDYGTFIVSSGRVDRDFGGSWLMLYGVKELVPLNRAYDHSEIHPGLVLFGSDGGGEGVGFDFRTEPPRVVLVNFVSAGWQDAIHQADTFAELCIIGPPVRTTASINSVPNCRSEWLDTTLNIGQSARVVSRRIQIATVALLATASGCGSGPSTRGIPTSPTTIVPDPTASYPLLTFPVDLSPYALSWTVDPSAVPFAADATSVPLVVVDTRCNGGASPEARLLPPTITYNDESIGITILATPLQGAQLCPGAPPAALTITLDQPVGDRTLVDNGGA